MNEKEPKHSPPPPISDEQKIKMMEQMIRTAPNQQIKQKLLDQLAELNKKNN